jgi:hypothetical protein
MHGAIPAEILSDRPCCTPHTRVAVDRSGDILQKLFDRMFAATPDMNPRDGSWTIRVWTDSTVASKVTRLQTQNLQDIHRIYCYPARYTACILQQGNACTVYLETSGLMQGGLMRIAEIHISRTDSLSDAIWNNSFNTQHFQAIESCTLYNSRRWVRISSHHRVDTLNYTLKGRALLLRSMSCRSCVSCNSMLHC